MSQVGEDIEVPKVVNHVARRLSITRAVAALIERAGIQKVSVRTVAAEAGLRPSTLRHYFPSSDEMLAGTITMVRERQAARFAQVPSSGDAQADIRTAWLHALPLDAERRTEAHVWLAITAVARTPELRRVLADINDGLDQLCAATVRVYSAGKAHPRESEAMMLRAFTDGLAVMAITEPAAFPEEVITAALDAYLAHLAARGSGGVT